MQVPLMLKTGLLSGNCVQVTYKLSANLYWWRFIPKQKRQHHVSGHCHLTLHAAAHKMLHTHTA